MKAHFTLSMKQFTNDNIKKPTRTFHEKILAGLRYDQCIDWVQTKEDAEKIGEYLRPNELLIIHEGNDMYQVKLATYMQQIKYLKQYCKDKNKSINDAKTLREFLQEVRIIWD